MKVLQPLVMLSLQFLVWTGWGRIYKIPSQFSCLTALTYLKEKNFRLQGVVCNDSTLCGISKALEDICDLPESDKWLVRQIIIVRDLYDLLVERAATRRWEDAEWEKWDLVQAAKGNILVHSQPDCELFLNHAWGMGLDMLPDLYRMFAFKPLHNLHFNISKMLKMVIANSSCDIILTDLGYTQKNGKPLMIFKRPCFVGVLPIIQGLEIMTELLDWRLISVEVIRRLKWPAHWLVILSKECWREKTIVSSTCSFRSRQIHSIGQLHFSNKQK